MQEVFGAVKFMHDNGVVHRDLKVMSSLRLLCTMCTRFIKGRTVKFSNLLTTFLL